MITVFFTDQPVTDFESAGTTDTQQFKGWFHGLLERGVYWPASAYEAAFLSYAHSEQDINTIVAATRESFAELAQTAREVAV